jgi:hypothetical protein
MTTFFPQARLLLALLITVSSTAVLADPAHSPVLPDPQLTPGDVLTTDAKIIGVSGYTP